MTLFTRTWRRPPDPAELRDLVDEKAAVIARWQSEGHVAPLDPHHLIFSIWSMTQHYADFEVQVRLILGPDVDPFDGATSFVDGLLAQGLSPASGAAMYRL